MIEKSETREIRLDVTSDDPEDQGVTLRYDSDHEGGSPIMILYHCDGNEYYLDSEEAVAFADALYDLAGI